MNGANKNSHNSVHDAIYLNEEKYGLLVTTCPAIRLCEMYSL